VSCAAPAQKVIGEKAICEVITGSSAANFTATVKFRVWGFHPLLRVLVYVYFQRKTGTNTSASTWVASALKKDLAGRQVVLQPVFGSPTARSLEDGHEVNSGAEGIEYTCNLQNMLTGSVSGTWMAAVVAMPDDPMDGDLFCDLANRLSLDVDKVVPQITATFT
jgi:hypothetical protein